MFKLFTKQIEFTDRTSLTGVERFFDENEMIVSKTDLKGKITYVNDVFLRVSGFDENQLLGQPHSVIRHPHMPRCVFKLLWQKLSAKQEIFAYVNNRAANGDNYWVFALVTPSFDDAGQVVSYHSARRSPNPEIINNTIAPLYAKLLAVEQQAPNRKLGLENASQMLSNFIAEQGADYDEFILSL